MPRSSHGGRSGKPLSRRSFLSGSGVAAAGIAAVEQTFPGIALAGDPQPPALDLPALGPDAVPITLTVNGRPRTVAVEPRMTLAEVLRGPLQLTGTKVACDRGACSSCTVLLDDLPVHSCSTLALDAIGHGVTTIEGLAEDGALHPVQAAFIAHDALQCGFCTPGMVLSCVALLKRNPAPTADDVRAAISGHLCRCGSYAHIIEAVLDVAKRREG